MNGRTNTTSVTEVVEGVQVALEAPTNLVLTPLNARVDLTWTDPVDKYAAPDGQTATNPWDNVATWDHSIVVRKAGSAPTSPSDGELIYKETTRNQHQYTAYSDTDNVINDTVYYYAVYAVTTMDAVSDPVVDHCKPIKGTPVYRRDINESTDAYATASLDNYAIFTDGFDVFNYNDSLTRGSMTRISEDEGVDMAATANMVFLGGGYRYDKGSMPGNSYYHNYDTVTAYNKSFVQTHAENGLPTPRSPGVGIGFKNYVIFAGGRAGNNSGSLGRKDTSETTCYDESLTRISVSNISGGGDGLSATALSDYVLISAGSSASMNAYDSSLTRSRPTSLSESKYGAAAVTNDDNKAAFIGGKLNSFSGGTYGGASYTTDIYDASLTRSSGPAIPDGYMLRCDTWLQGHVCCGAYLILPLAEVGGMSEGLLYQYDLSFTSQPTVISGIESNKEFVYVSGRAGNYALVLRSDSHKFNVFEAI